MLGVKLIPRGRLRSHAEIAEFAESHIASLVRAIRMESGELVTRKLCGFCEFCVKFILFSCEKDLLLLRLLHQIHDGG